MEISHHVHTFGDFFGDPERRSALCAPNIPVAPGRMSLLQSGPVAAMNPDSAWRFDKILKHDGVSSSMGRMTSHIIIMENKIHV